VVSQPLSLAWAAGAMPTITAETIARPAQIFAPMRCSFMVLTSL
jgi:hypothetical protein